MSKFKKYGSFPYNIAVLHGGPGAIGGMEAVAKELSEDVGVLEPFGLASSIDGQIKELYSVINENGELPITLIGWSWGAWLGFIFASRYPKLVKKLIIIGSGPFLKKYAKDIMPNRLSRLSEKEKERFLLLIQSLSDDDLSLSSQEIEKLFSKTDYYNPLLHDRPALEFRKEVYQKVWPEADELRRSGKLLELGKDIECPVVALHGDHDPHPAKGVRDPLSRVLNKFKFILLKKCGHYPWLEHDAREEFFSILKKEIFSD